MRRGDSLTHPPPPHFVQHLPKAQLCVEENLASLGGGEPLAVVGVWRGDSLAKTACGEKNTTPSGPSGHLPKGRLYRFSTTVPEEEQLSTKKCEAAPPSEKILHIACDNFPARP